MHLAIHSGDGAVGIDDNRGVVIDARRSSLENRSDNDDFSLASERAQGLGRRTGNRLRQFEIPLVFTLAKVTRAKEFLETNNLRAFFCRQVHPIDGLAEIDGWILTGAHLDEPQCNILSSCFFRHVVTLSDRSIYSLDIKKGEKRLFPFLSLTLIKMNLL